jgi:FAD/FMN-containing dehydrogenase/Fe-S oxidoreductase
MPLPADFVAELKKSISGDVRLDPASRVLYSTDASIYQIEPLGVVLPRTLDDLNAAVQLAAKYKIPVLPRGAGSSLAGQAVGQALILDCSRWLDKIVEIDAENRTATVQPGVVLAALNKAAARYGLQFGPDPASAERATMGGVIGNNATGAHSILYGMTADHLLSAEVVMANGETQTWGEIDADELLRVARVTRDHIYGNATCDNPSSDQHHWNNALASLYRVIHEICTYRAASIRAGWPRTWRNSAGYRLNYLIPWSPSHPPHWSEVEGQEMLPYPPVGEKTLNLAPLLAGSEGTLAIVRTATLRLVPKPLYTVLGILAYDSVAAACDAVPAILAHEPSAVELIPKNLIELARSLPGFSAQVDFVGDDAAAVLAVEFSGSRPEVLLERLRSLRPVYIAETPSQQARIWTVRKVGLGILDSRPSAQRPVAVIEDCAIPVERLGNFVRGVERILAEHQVQASFYAHASAGCLHIRPVLDLRTGAGVHGLRSIAEAVLSLTLQLGGVMSSEHGDGLARSEFLRQIYGDEVLASFRDLKRAADPYGILNPGKIVDPPPMDVNLRYGEAYRAQAWKPRLDFSRNGGLEMAIEQCNGQGVCRKADGVMCPSFQAAREEMYSTRGRANLLRALISGSWRGSDSVEAVRQALDLCLACKGCKTECPSGVDMAKLKYEFLAHYYQTHHRQLRDYLFGYIGLLAQVGAPFGQLANVFTQSTWGRQVMAALFAIAQQRTLPAFGRFRSNQKPLTTGSETVLYLPDTFSHFFEPEVEQAALRLLAAANCRVIILPVFGAGRTLISKGFLDAARRHAVRLLGVIRRFDPAGRLCVVGVEPSEIYTLRDEFLDLLPDSEEVQRLTERAWMVEEFLLRPDISNQVRVERLLSRYPLSLSLQTKILLHGHCYQKSRPPAADGYPVGQAASAELLRRFGYQVELIPSGCCGMAGAFGYEAEHYDLSMQIAELTLFPAVRQANAPVAAAGTSCRSQIADGTGVHAEHPLVVAARQVSIA